MRCGAKAIINGLEDNTYENVFGENGYGARASAKLLQVQGKKFQHEKTKAKRSSSYKGGAIDASAASKASSTKIATNCRYIVDTVLHCKNTLCIPLNNYPSRCKTSSALEPPPAGATLVHLLLMLLVPQ